MVKEPLVAGGRAVDRFLAADPFLRDVHPVLAQARAETPVAEVVTTDDGGTTTRCYYVFDYSTVRTVLSDTGRFSNIAYAPQMRQLAGRTMLEMDPPSHHRYRSLVAPFFRSRLLTGRHSGTLHDIAAELIDRLCSRGRVELLSELTLPFPLRALAACVGIPDSDYEFFRDRASRMIDVHLPWPRVATATEELSGYFTELIAARRRSASSSGLIDDLIAARRGDDALSDEEIRAFLMLLIPAGIETTHRVSSTLVFALLRHPEQLARVRADRSLISVAFDEALRWEPAVAGAMRIAKTHTRLGSVRIPAGSLVYASLVAANRDPGHYSEPDRFDIFRDGPQHLTFGFGPHMCIGMHLARIEVDVLLNALLDRLPGLRFDPDQPEPFIHGKIYRVPNRLDLIFDTDRP